MAPLVMHGACDCGDVSVRIQGIDFDDGQPRGHICHCFECRQQTGAHYAHNLDVPAEQLAIEGCGQLTSYASPSSVPGKPSMAWFCARCGSPEDPGLFCVRLGLFPTVPPPAQEMIEWQKVPWLRDKIIGLPTGDTNAAIAPRDSAENGSDGCDAADLASSKAPLSDSTER